MDTEQHIEPGRTYQLKNVTRWGGLFKVRIINDIGTVCGFYVGASGVPRQGACFKANEFKDMISNEHKTKSQDFKESALPLIKWLAENKNPHAKVIVTSIGAELLEGIRSTGEIVDYVKD